MKSLASPSQKIKFCALKFTVSAFFVTLAAPSVYAEESEPEVLIFMGLTGTCSELVIDDEPVSCSTTLFHSEHEDARIGFFYLADAPDHRIVVFSGDGNTQKAPSTNVRLQPIDGLVVNERMMEGRLKGNAFSKTHILAPPAWSVSLKMNLGCDLRGTFYQTAKSPELFHSDFG